jgi:uncharacterized membrane protein YkgB
MNPDQEKMMRETLRISRENNEMLTKLFKAQRRSRVWSIFKTLIYIAVIIGVYYFMAPYIDSLMDAYKSIQENIEKFQGVKDSFNFN